MGDAAARISPGGGGVGLGEVLAAQRARGGAAGAGPWSERLREIAQATERNLLAARAGPGSEPGGVGAQVQSLSFTPGELSVSKAELKQLAASAAAATADLRVEAQAAWGLGAQARALTPLNTNTPLIEALTHRVKKLEGLDVSGEKLERLERAYRATEEGGGLMKGTIQNLEGRVQEVSRAVAASREGSEVQSTTIQTLVESVERIASRIGALEAKMPDLDAVPRSASLDGLPVEVEERFQSLESQIQRLTAAAGGRTAEVEEKVNDAESMLKSVESKVKSLELLESQVRHLNSKADNIHKLEDRFTGEVGQLTKGIRALERAKAEQSETYDATFKRMGQDIDDLSRTVQDANANVEKLSADLLAANERLPPPSQPAGTASDVEHMKNEFAKSVDSIEKMEQDLRSELWEVRCIAQEAQDGTRVNELQAKIESSAEDVQIHMSSIKRAAASAEQVAADAEESVSQIQKMCEEQQSAVEKLSSALQERVTKQTSPSAELEGKVSSIASTQEALNKTVEDVMAAVECASEASKVSMIEVQAEIEANFRDSIHDLAAKQTEMEALRDDLLQRLTEQAEGIARLECSSNSSAGEGLGDKVKGLMDRMQTLESSMQIEDSEGGGKESTREGIIQRLEDHDRTLTNMKEQQLTIADIIDAEGGTLLAKLNSLEERISAMGTRDKSVDLQEMFEKQARTIASLEEKFSSFSSAKGVQDVVEELESQGRAIASLRERRLTLTDISDEDGGTLKNKLQGLERKVSEAGESQADAGLVEKLEDQGRAIASLRERRLTLTDISDEDGGTLKNKLQGLERKVSEAGESQADAGLVEKLEDQGRAIASLRERRITLADIATEDGSDLLTKLRVMESKFGGFEASQSEQQESFDDRHDNVDMPSAGSSELLVPTWAREEEKFNEAKSELQANMDGLEEKISQVKQVMGKCATKMQEIHATGDDSSAKSFEISLHVAQLEYQGLEKDLRFTREEIVTIDSAVASPTKMTPEMRSTQTKSRLGLVHNISEKLKQQGDECSKLKENLDALMETGVCENLSAERSAFASSIHESLEYSLEDTTLSEGTSIMEGDATTSFESDSAMAGSGSLQAEEEGILAEIRKTEARIAQYNGWSLEVEILQMNLDELKKDLQRVRSSNSGSTPVVTGSSDSVGDD